MSSIILRTIWQKAKRSGQDGHHGHHEHHPRVVLRDIEQSRKRLADANDQITLLNEKLANLGEARIQFLASVGHELRTPLTLMLAPLEKQLRETRSLDRDLRRDLEVIQRNARTVLRHVNDLLDLAQVQEGEVTCDYALVDAAGLVRAIAAHFAALADDQRITFVLDVPSSLSVRTDAEKFQRIVMNLLSNAFALAPTGGSVRVALREMGRRFQLEVADSGIAIPADQESMVFEPIGSLEGSAAPLPPSTGLDLSIVRTFAEILGGTVSVGDAPERGTLVIVDLPADPDAVDVRTDAGEPAAGGDGQGVETHDSTAATPADAPARAGRVLVVEDNPSLNSFVCECLRRDGFDVTAAFDGADAYDKITREHPDLVLTDVAMPGLSGDELVHRVRQQPEFDSMPIIILTGKTGGVLDLRLLREGAQDCLFKPFSVDELRSRVRDVVARKRANDHMTSLKRRLDAVTVASEEIAQAVASLPGESVQTVFQTIALSAQNLTGATYAAAAIGGDETHPFDVCAIVGMTPEEIASLGEPPRPVGLLGLVATENRTIRERDLREHPDFRGVPPGHPELTSFLGVPVRYRGHAVGNLYLANKRDGGEFTEEDQQVIELLASRAGIAIETAQLYAAEGRAHAWLQASIDQMPEGIILTDAEGHITMENQSLRGFANTRTQGFERNGSLMAVDLRSPSGEPLAFDDVPIVRAINSREITHGRELVGRRQDDSVVPLLVSAAPIVMADGKLAGAAMVIQDVTPLKQLEHLREEWASIVAHDLRQPISVIALRTSLLQRAGVGEQQREDLRQIRVAADSLSRMANDLMDASLLDTGRMNVTLERIELGQLIRDVVERVPLAAPYTRLQIPAGTLLFIQGDPQRLEQVVGNLLSNAVKYGTPEAEVCLTLTHTDHDVAIVVTNRGPGIPADELPFVFDRYSRSRSAQSGTTAGLGLGLNIAKGLVAAHAGRIWAESVPDGVTAFHITLPLDGPPIASEVPVAAASHTPNVASEARPG